MRTSDRSRCTRIGSAGVAFVALLITLAAGPAQALPAQEMPVPVEVQVPLLAKVLAFDRKLAADAGAELVLGVLFQSRFRTSANVADEVREAVRRLPKGGVGGRPLRVVTIDLDDAANLGAILARQQVTVLYVAPLRAVDVHAVADVCRSGRITTVTGVPAYVESGLAIGIGTRGERPEIVVNLPASRAEGADLNAQLLKLARIVE